MCIIKVCMTMLSTSMKLLKAILTVSNRDFSNSIIVTSKVVMVHSQFRTIRDMGVSTASMETNILIHSRIILSHNRTIATLPSKNQVQVDK